MQNVALISGLCGALLSAGLSYWIRASLDKRVLRIAETRLAYVHLVRISDLVAIDVVIRAVAAIVVSGAATTSEAKKLLLGQVASYKEYLSAKLQHQPKLQTALSEAEKEIDE